MAAMPGHQRLPLAAKWTYRIRHLPCPPNRVSATMVYVLARSRRTG